MNVNENAGKEVKKLGKLAAYFDPVSRLQSGILDLPLLDFFQLKSGRSQTPV